ncbi:MAG: spore protease YyaC [Bacillota bacterium]
MSNKKAVASEAIYKGIKVNLLDGKDDLIAVMNALIPNALTNNDVVFVCIGTDRSCGDSLGPFVGMYLEGLGYENVYGTIDNPVHALNLKETLENIPKNKTVIAIDASLGKDEDIGMFSLIKGSTKPGAGVGKDLGEVGDYGIHGCVNVGGNMEYFVLNNTRLSIVMKMAKDITSSIHNTFPLKPEVQENVDKTVINEEDNIIVKRLKNRGFNAKLMKV